MSFTGTLDISSLPGIPSGSIFSGSFTYSTTDGASLTAPGDGLSLQVGGFAFAVSPSVGLTWAAYNAPSFIYPDLDFFAVHAGCCYGHFTSNYSIPGHHLITMAAQLIGDSSFLSSNALPSVFDTSHIILGPHPPVQSASVIAFSNDDLTSFYSASGTILSISASVSDVPEPSVAQLTWVGFALLGLGRAIGRAQAHRRTSRR